MKFTISRNTLLNTLNNVSKGLSSKTPMPSLTGIYVEAEFNKLVFTTTNRELSIQVVVPVSENLEIEESGSCLIPGKYFVEIIKKIEDESITVAIFDETAIKIITERSQFTLNALEKEVFPKLTFEGEGEPILFSAQNLKTIIKQTSFSASTSEQRLVLTGVNFEINKDELFITATDSFRLSRKNTKLDGTYDKKKINIPSKSIEEFNKILEENQEVVELYLINNKALFKYQNVSFVTRLIEGTYPDVSSLFPKNSLVDLKFNKNELIAAIDRAALLNSNDNLNLVKIQISPNKKVKILSTSTEIGNVEEDIYPLMISETLQLQVAFSAKYLLEALKAFDSNEITIHFTGEIKPFIIKSEEDPELIQLILPARIFN